jgi:hypothetical protein
VSEHPLADLYIARPTDALGPRYKPLRGRASWAVRLLVVTAAVNALSFLVELRDRSLLDASQPGLFGRLTSYDAHQALLLDAFLATMLATVVVFLCWLHRAHRNASRAYARTGGRWAGNRSVPVDWPSNKKAPFPGLSE